ncbi:hypothetical protein BGX23_002842 [Mortierella sp. AD031]|nr:hypothetical protein BGX23_002842 [Mortierella sp. AD031]
MESLSTNYSVYEPWKILGLGVGFCPDHPSTSIPPIDIVTQGTREKSDGITPKPKPGTLSFLVLDDIKKKVKGGKSAKPRNGDSKQSGCKSGFTAYQGISKPVMRGGE